LIARAIILRARPQPGYVSECRCWPAEGSQRHRRCSTLLFGELRPRRRVKTGLSRLPTARLDPLPEPDRRSAAWDAARWPPRHEPVRPGLRRHRLLPASSNGVAQSAATRVGRLVRARGCRGRWLPRARFCAVVSHRSPVQRWWRYLDPSQAQLDQLPRQHMPSLVHRSQRRETSRARTLLTAQLMALNA
jgi:hypothetical protein